MSVIQKASIISIDFVGIPRRFCYNRSVTFAKCDVSRPDPVIYNKVLKKRGTVKEIIEANYKIYSVLSWPLFDSQGILQTGITKPELPKQQARACPRMPFFLNSSLFRKNNACNIKYMTVLVFQKCLDLRKNAYSRTTS